MCFFISQESGMQLEACRFELQSAVEWRMVVSRGPDERTDAIYELLCSARAKVCRIENSSTMVQLGSCWAPSNTSGSELQV